MDSKRDWDHKLTATLLAYKTTYKVSTRTTPFSLVFGIEVILSMGFEVPSLRIVIDEQLDDSQSLKDRLERLEGVSEARRLAAQHVETTQRQRKVYFDKKVKRKTLSAGMWVMVQDSKRLEFLGKFDALWTGLYIIKEVFPNNSVQLKNLYGLEFPTHINGGQCKEYKE
jgi:hypothetical protein